MNTGTARESVSTESSQILLHFSPSWLDFKDTAESLFSLSAKRLSVSDSCFQDALASKDMFPNNFRSDETKILIIIKKS